eukprot:TRINITY_DN1967_c0_g1_i4.p1 TRINITY_DN1967_c0_g1~~TRINITY_DN1967_c0_g1_i4.p1  ORF type:complete len:189 (-),score=17.01 TRINITY_DN1967_c0_g1_i4:25-591(-)
MLDLSGLENYEERRLLRLKSKGLHLEICCGVTGGIFIAFIIYVIILLSTDHYSHTGQIIFFIIIGVLVTAIYGLGFHAAYKLNENELLIFLVCNGVYFGFLFCSSIFIFILVVGFIHSPVVWLWLLFMVAQMASFVVGVIFAQELRSESNRTTVVVPVNADSIPNNFLEVGKAYELNAIGKTQKVEVL